MNNKSIFKADPIQEEFKKVGKLLFDLGVAGVKSGNISVLKGGKIYITRHNASLGSLSPDDIASFDLNSSPPEESSVETIVHQYVYLKTARKSVVHIHPVYATSIGFFLPLFVPVDVEGKYYFPGGVPVLSLKKPFASKELAEEVSDKAREHKGVIVKAHGSFVFGNSLTECLHLADILERSSKIYYLSHLIGGGKQ